MLSKGTQICLVMKYISPEMWNSEYIFDYFCKYISDMSEELIIIL